MAVRFALLAFAWITLITGPARSEVTLIDEGQPAARIVIDTRGSAGEGPEVLVDAGRWLADSLKAASGAVFRIDRHAGDEPAVVIARADAWPEVARQAGYEPEDTTSYAIITQPNRVYILGACEDAARHGVADLLYRWGFRWFAPSPKWHIIPEIRDLTVSLNTIETPALRDRRVWYAYGMSGNDLRPLMDNYERWAIANRLSVKSLMRTGHSYGGIIRRNQAEFERNPEMYALLPNGKRDSERPIEARKFCFTNPDLINLVVKDARRRLAAERKRNTAAFMVSVDPSDGEGTCHCPNCEQLGTTSDRVFHLANAVARALRAEDPNAWVGLYAYSSHRLPPTIDVEPNVYVQVAMGFNRTEYSLPELVQLWSDKVEAIGLREYYGVEAWDWGLPGRARGGQVRYHRKWIPYYAARKLDAINAETNANWSVQTLGLYVAAQLMWNPQADVSALVDEFLELAFGEAAEPMRRFYDTMESAPPLQPFALIPLFEQLEEAWNATEDPAVRNRLMDLKAYLVYVVKFREFDLVREKSRNRGDEYYEALEPLMNYAWRIRHRDIVHYYALARRLCNGLPIRDKRLDFYMNTERPGGPIWQYGPSHSDAEIDEMFRAALEQLRADGDPTVPFSRHLDRVEVPGDDAGPSGIHRDEREGIARFRGNLVGYLVPSEASAVRMALQPTSRPVSISVFDDDETLFEREVRPNEGFHELTVELPKAGEYRVEIMGDCELSVPPETPFVFEASALNPAQIDYSGPHYFYVPRGTEELVVKANPRLSLIVPGIGRRDLGPADRAEGKGYIVVPVPDGTDGRLWHTMSLTRGEIALLNVPPLLSFHRDTVFIPREVAESNQDEGLKAKR